MSMVDDDLIGEFEDFEDEDEDEDEEEIGDWDEDDPEGFDPPHPFGDMG